MKILLLGGDRRMLYAARRFTALGHEATLGHFESQCEFSDLKFTDDWRKELPASQIIVLPFFDKNSHSQWQIMGQYGNDEVNARDIAELVSPTQRVFAAMPPSQVSEMFFRRGLSLHDYFAREELAISNAVPTAQGVIALMIENLETAIAHCCVCILGYGRCARALARALRGMGARVFIWARKARDRAQIVVDGYENSGKLAKDSREHNSGSRQLKGASVRNMDFDCVVNTVPAQILGREQLALLNRDCLLIEIASSPFGIDKIAAQELDMPYIYAPSLPGKTAPKTAGEIIADTINAMILDVRD